MFVYYVPCMYPYAYYPSMPTQNYRQMPTQSYAHPSHSYLNERQYENSDYGKEPIVFNIDQATYQNETFRTAIWTGDHLQVTLMSIQPGEDIGLEMHPNVDQFLKVEQGQGIVQMGESELNLPFESLAGEGSAILIPAGTWHNVTNTGQSPLKLYSIYAPPNHPFGTVHKSKADALAAEDHENNE
ncbi:mannose-6-phosphate isomerase-like protein (cupin superfamily) [Geomicrobium sediminis]|uniref:Mannose-6-phosphate isomerase-like protein (Cupin superfamily) n=1 Tax=Geomicrobium sediminis TaxID=1347788 RepID=A0ABS2P7I2_9BACL|nr:cupin domain-containing protein [Geomicrobium sediminis]MBM7631030.1 mannose-6-phosphate isomerase-like protein (cupin superfamily) [Geomicrobium sediminis]